MKTCILALAAFMCAASLSADDGQEAASIWISVPRFPYDWELRDAIRDSSRDSAAELGLSPAVEATEVILAFAAQIMHSSRVHPGVDVDVALGSPVRAAGKGIVEPVDHDAMGLGNFVVVHCGARLYTVYGHLRRVVVKKTDLVDAGALLEYSGQTGLTQVPYLHFAVLRAMSERGY